MHRHHSSITLALLGLLCVLALPLDPLAAVSNNASKVPGCLVADAPPPPPPVGDEDFFTVSGGSITNVMLLLDSSGSMIEFPLDVAWQNFTSTTAGEGVCTSAALPYGPFKGLTVDYPGVDKGGTNKLRLSDTPYDNGWTTSDGNMVDAPPWGLTRCTAKQGQPSTDNSWDYCLFRPTSYYKLTQDGDENTFFTPTRARTYNANPCAAVNSSGAVLKDNTNAVVKAADVNACNTCLANDGWYMFRARYKNNSGNWVFSPTQLVFSGKFLNANPLKYIVARKVVKDLVKMDQNATADQAKADPVRFGLTIFSGGDSSGQSSALRTGDGGRLIVPVGPNCQDSHPLATHKAQYQAARQAIVNAINAVNTAGDTPTYLPFSSYTPLAETLYNIGQYFNNTGTSSPYDTMFTASNWQLPRTGDTRDFKETSRGEVNASWASSNQASFCWACQKSSAIVITDGEPTNDENLPTDKVTSNHSALKSGTYYDFRKWTNSTIDCASCGGALLPKVSYFLSQTDLRADMANTAGPQTVSTYTISFGLACKKDLTTGPSTNPLSNATDDVFPYEGPDATACNVLDWTAKLGSGKFANTSSGEELKEALNTAVTDVVDRAVSFSSSSSSSLQSAVSTTADSYLARFKPTGSVAWEGHLYGGMVFDEFGEGCDSTKTHDAQKLLKKCGTATDVNPDIDGQEGSTALAKCDSGYIVDKECDPIIEDATTGSFKKGYFSSTGQLLAGTDPAVMYWDAGLALSDPNNAGYRTAVEGQDRSRKIYTVIDTDGNGRLTRADGLTELTRANAAALAPYMALDQTWCEKMEAAAGICGGAVPACPAWTDAARVTCAKMVIDFVRGYDVLDEDGDHCGGPDDYQNTHTYGTCTAANYKTACGTSDATCSSGVCSHTACAAGEQRDRANDNRATDFQTFWKLGDIFHSSPILVKAPAHKKECDTGLVNQCVYTIYTPTRDGPTLQTYTTSGKTYDAYDQWRRDVINRQRILLVGANDGIFHAFDAGAADTNSTRNSEGQHTFGDGTGAELWGFIPPDLLPRLKKSLEEHTYFVDGTAMIRDIWTDLDGDRVKTKDEFRTVAVITERGGGSHYTALDVTDPTSPVFLWTFPEPGTEDARLVGQSWSEFAPKPPPIGPVKLARGSAFEERWIVFLNGGYDPALVRGRGVWMLDAYTGAKLWRWTDADFVTMRGNATAHMGPITGAISMSDIGAADTSVAATDSDGYFDTALFGDLFGNLFVARFHEPGTLTNGLVTNWSAARTFEMNRQSNDAQIMRKRSQFFQMPASVLDPPSRLMGLVGTGNRERLMDGTPECSPEDLLGCCKSGCAASGAVTGSYGYGCSMSGTFSCDATGAISYTTPAPTSQCASGPGTTCGTTTQSSTFSFTCGSTAQGPFSGSLTCDQNGTCTTDQDVGSGQAPSTSLLSCAQGRLHDCMFGVWAFGANDDKRFTETDTSWASQRAFEGNRFTDNKAFTGTCGSFGTCALVDATSSLTTTDKGVTSTTCQDSGVGTCVATNRDPGWKYCYGHYCPTASCSTASWCDELTGTAPSGGYQGCMQFSTFRPTAVGGTTTVTNPCNSSEIGTLSTTSYLVDAISGVPTPTCGYSALTSPPAITHFRAKTSTAGSAPKTSTVRVTVNEKGEVGYSTFGETTSGSSKTGMGARASTSELLYTVPITPAEHTCRHTPPQADPTKARNCK